MTDPGAPRFGTLVSFILERFDKATEKAARPDATDWAKGEEEALKCLLYWLEGYAQASPEKLRERYALSAEGACSTPEGK